MVRVFSALVALPAAVSAVPFTVNRYNSIWDHNVRPYKAPGPNDSRGPCPMLNTLANHGYINHDGRDIEQQDLLKALSEHVGVTDTAVATAFSNAITLCNFITGTECGTTLKNLTLLALPHAFEHDHSFSRGDYKPKWIAGPDDFDDNKNFNASIFQTSLDVLGGSKHMNYQQMNQVRLQREALSKQDTYTGWFLEAKAIQEFEAGFIFAVMGDFNLPNHIAEPQVRVEWWNYWFSNEAFPYELGWHRPSPKKDVHFMLSASSRILAAPVTSTPTPLVSGAIGPADEPVLLPTQVNTITYELPFGTPYVGPIATEKGLGHNNGNGLFKRGAEAAQATPAPTAAFTPMNPYVQTLAHSDIVKQQAIASSRMAQYT